MYWSKKKPTKEGWYWLRNKKEIGIVFVRLYCDELCITNWPIPDDAEWSGPIEEPWF